MPLHVDHTKTILHCKLYDSAANSHFAAMLIDLLHPPLAHDKLEPSVAECSLYDAACLGANATVREYTPQQPRANTSLLLLPSSYTNNDTSSFAPSHPYQNNSRQSNRAHIQPSSRQQHACDRCNITTPHTHAPPTPTYTNVHKPTHIYQHRTLFFFTSLDSAKNGANMFFFFTCGTHSTSCPLLSVFPCSLRNSLLSPTPPPCLPALINPSSTPPLPHPLAAPTH